MNAFLPIFEGGRSILAGIWVRYSCTIYEKQLKNRIVMLEGNINWLSKTSFSTKERGILFQMRFSLRLLYGSI